MLIFGLAFSNSLMQGKRGRPMRYSAFVEDRPTLSAVVSRIQEISTLPHVAMHIMQVAGKPDCGVTELTAALEADASLSARVLRCVNSAAYAVRVRVTNLQMAVAYLGTKQIRNLALTASISDLFLENEAIGPYRRSELWRHLVSVGLCARMIAMRRKVAAFEDAFLAGLLHDIGIVLEDQYLHKQFAGMIAALDGKKTLAETERSHFDFDHMILGGMVAGRHSLPPPRSAGERARRDPANRPLRGAGQPDLHAQGDFFGRHQGCGELRARGQRPVAHRRGRRRDGGGPRRHARGELRTVPGGGLGARPCSTRLRN
jgi:hypothetical protein